LPAIFGIGDDDTPRKLAYHIPTRTVRRAGELLKQFDGKGNNQHKVGTDPTQKQAASDAGMSERQAKTAVRVANVPEHEFLTPHRRSSSLVLSWVAMNRMKSPHPVDIHVGRRIRIRRVMRELSQSNLADQLGLTYQQLQKYESGANRISASRLWQIAQILETPVGWFFEGLGSATPHAEDLVGTEALKMINTIQALPKDLEARLSAAIKAIADSVPK
jgi:transcriptional regulator with XRE-family HTH domain